MNDAPEISPPPGIATIQSRLVEHIGEAKTNTADAVTEISNHPRVETPPTTPMDSSLTQAASGRFDPAREVTLTPSPDVVGAQSSALETRAQEAKEEISDVVAAAGNRAEIRTEEIAAAQGREQLRRENIRAGLKAFHERRRNALQDNPPESPTPEAVTAESDRFLDRWRSALTEHSPEIAAVVGTASMGAAVLLGQTQVGPEAQMIARAISAAGLGFYLLKQAPRA